MGLKSTAARRRWLGAVATSLAALAGFRLLKRKPVAFPVSAPEPAPAPTASRPVSRLTLAPAPGSVKRHG